MISLFMPPAAGGKITAIAPTAFARPEDRTKAMRAGRQTHMAKSMNGYEPAATVASFAGRIARGPAPVEA